jgi:hypothetical protein
VSAGRIVETQWGNGTERHNTTIVFTIVFEQNEKFLLDKATVAIVCP